VLQLSRRDQPARSKQKTTIVFRECFTRVSPHRRRVQFSRAEARANRDASLGLPIRLAAKQDGGRGSADPNDPACAQCGNYVY
jgi:hypothetical protein